MRQLTLLDEADPKVLALLARFTDGLKDPAFGRFVLRDDNAMSGHNKMRVIYPPNDDMRYLQQRFLYWLNGLSLPLEFATGGNKGDSPLGNVQRHRHNRYFYLTDIKGAFEHLLVERVAAALCLVAPELAASQTSIEDFLWLYCRAEGGGLATGSPSSTLLFNLSLGVAMDAELGEYCEAHGITYSRYIDDLAFSGPQPITASQRQRIRSIVASHGFEVSRRKSQVLDLAKSTIVVNGVGLELGGRTFVPRPYLRRLKGMLLRAWQQGDVKPAEVYGRMGAMKSCLGEYKFSQLTAEERKVMRLYYSWHARQQRRQKLVRGKS